MDLRAVAGLFGEKPGGWESEIVRIVFVLPLLDVNEDEKIWTGC